MRVRNQIALAAAVAGTAAALAFACALPDTRYGAPSDLAASKLPGTDTLACDAGAAEVGDGARSCHGPDAAAPLVDGQDASAALASLEAWQLSTHPGVPYVGTSGDFTKSTIDCNLGGFCTATMPTLPAQQLTADDRCRLCAWLACGAPDN